MNPAQLEHIRKELGSRRKEVDFYAYSPLTVKAASVTDGKAKALDENGRLRVASLASTPDIDEHGEIVEVSAFASSIESFGKNPVMLAYHKMDEPVGIWDAQSITGAGLAVEGFISNGRPDIQQLVLDGVIKHTSIGFFVRDIDWDEELQVLRITDLDLIEVSLVPIPANRSTTLDVLSAAKGWAKSKAMEPFEPELPDMAPVTKAVEAEEVEPAQEREGIGLVELPFAEIASAAAVLSKELAGAMTGTR